MRLFTLGDVNHMTWAEVDETVTLLTKSVTDYFSVRAEDVHVVSPLLRSGGITGSLVAIRLHVTTMLPVQFKNYYNPRSLSQVISVPNILVPLPQQFNVLLCEGNTSSGTTAVAAAEAIHVKYPHSKIYLATLTKVFGGPDHLPGIEHCFYGRCTDENFIATPEQVTQHNLRPGITVFPWERAEEELEDINAVH